MGFLDRLKKSDDGKRSLKSVKHHGTSRRSTLSMKIKHTLGSGNMAEAVRVPDGEDLNDWLAANTVDFFNEVSLLYGLCYEDASRFQKPDDGGFPPGFEYHWKATASEKPVRVSSPEYVDYVMTWVEDQIDNPKIFPATEEEPFAPEFATEYVPAIMSKMFRIFAIMYNCHFKEIEKLDAVAHLNTVFKHFMFFSFEFKLVNEREFRALKKPVQKLLVEYQEKKQSLK